MTEKPFEHEQRGDRLAIGDPAVGAHGHGHIQRHWTQLNLLETTTPSESENRTLVGGTVGGGIEWMFAPRWSLKAEYLYVSYQSQQYFGVACCTLENRYLTNNIGRVGLNLHF